MGDMAEKDDGAVTEEAVGVTSFSQLLLSDDGDGDGAGAGEEVGFGFGFSFSGGGGPRMLCFGGEYQNDAELLFPESSVCCSDSNSPVSSSCNSSKNTNNDVCTVEKSTKPNKKRTGSGNGQDPDCDGKIVKKSKKSQNKSSLGNAKVRKEKLGERIAALQQLVSPYGKTDTASVLHEAMGYIKFLQDQVQVLCSPYLIPHPQMMMTCQDGVEIGDQKTKTKDLRSRGLCLVPVSCTVHVANTNGADFWSPAMCHSMSAAMNQ